MQLTAKYVLLTMQVTFVSYRLIFPWGYQKQTNGDTIREVNIISDKAKVSSGCGWQVKLYFQPLSLRQNPSSSILVTVTRIYLKPEHSR